MSSVFITCAVTGSGDTTGKSDKVPVVPEQIAADCIAAARAGAAVVHIHVRDPITGVGSRETELYAEVVERVRASDVDVVVNLTAGMGGDLTFGSAERPFPVDEAGTDLAGASERLDHVRRLRPEICTLDCGTMNFGEGDYIMTNSTATLKEMARQIQALGVRPEIEAFDTGHVWQAKTLADEGLIDDPVMIQLCMGVPWGAPPDLNTFMAMVNNLPDSWTWERVLDRPPPDGVRRARSDRRRQHPRRTGGQPVPRPRSARLERRSRDPRGRDPRTARIRDQGPRRGPCRSEADPA